MSGYANANRKLMCARADGIFNDYSDDIHGRLLYTVPSTSSVANQKRALAAAIILAQNEHVGVVIPPAFFENERVPFCHLFDANSLPQQQGFMMTSVSKAKRDYYCSEKNVTDIILPWHKYATQCIRFESLLHYTRQLTASAKNAKRFVQQEFNITSCDPKDPVVKRHHACFSKS